LYLAILAETGGFYSAFPNQILPSDPYYPSWGGYSTYGRRLYPLWLKDPGPRSEKRTLLCDMACFLLITPLAAISGWLCLRGAQDHLQLKSRLEAVSFRYHCQLYSEWRRTNQKVRLLMPDMKGAHTTQRSVPTKSTKKMTDETIV
ncbi:E3 ubiquitin-protein ligase marchf2, partial [Xenoophorus captivus]